jgi:Domain of unknown function (DUF222)
MAAMNWPDGWIGRLPRSRRSALSPLAAPRPTTDTEVDPRTVAQRDADALVELAQRTLTDGELPTEGGERPQVVVTVRLPVLQGRIGSASLALGGPVNADIARRITCGAEVIPVVLGSRGEPLDVGRASRTVPTAIRRAVIVRDRGCAFLGVLSQPAGAKFIMWSIWSVMVRSASETALRCAVATTDYSTTPTGGSRWPAVSQNSTHHLAGRCPTPQSNPPRPQSDPNPPVAAAMQRSDNKRSGDESAADTFDVPCPSSLE